MNRKQAKAANGNLAVLVVDDDYLMQRLIVTFLSNLGHSGVIVGDGKEAIACLAARDFDVVLLDVMMPVMDGLETLKVIRDAEQISGMHQPIIMLTGHAEPNDVVRLKQAGADGYASKPINLVQLNAELTRITHQFIKSN